MVKDSKWLFWGFIALVVINIILLLYIFAGSSVRLSPVVGADYCNDKNPLTVCNIGDNTGRTMISLFGSRITDIGDGYLKIMTDNSKGIKLSGLKWVAGGSISEVKTNVSVNGNLYADNLFADNIINSRFETIDPLNTNKTILLKVKVYRDLYSGLNYTSITRASDGVEVCSDRRIGDICYIDGETALQIFNISYTSGGEASATFNLLNGKEIGTIKNVATFTQLKDRYLIVRK